MADNHLWFSVFAYHLPSANRFTRIQRCTCCYVLFFISLLMNVLYFDINRSFEANELDQYGVSFGPFHISKDEVIFINLLFFFFSSFFKLD